MTPEHLGFVEDDDGGPLSPQPAAERLTFFQGYLKYRKRLLAYVECRARELNLAENVADTEGIVQETFERALPYWDTINPHGYYAYLRKIANGLLSARIKDDKRRGHADDDDQERPSRHVGRPRARSAEDVLDRIEVTERIRKIPPRQRKALWRRAVDGDTSEEIGKELDCPTDAVDSLVRRARLGARGSGRWTRFERRLLARAAIVLSDSRRRRLVLIGIRVVAAALGLLAANEVWKVQGPAGVVLVLPAAAAAWLAWSRLKQWIQDRSLERADMGRALLDRERIWEYGILNQPSGIWVSQSAVGPSVARYAPPLGIRSLRAGRREPELALAHVCDVQRRRHCSYDLRPLYVHRRSREIVDVAMRRRAGARLRRFRIVMGPMRLAAVMARAVSEIRHRRRATRRGVLTPRYGFESSRRGERRRQRVQPWMVDNSTVWVSNRDETRGVDSSDTGSYDNHLDMLQSSRPGAVPHADRAGRRRAPRGSMGRCRLPRRSRERRSLYLHGRSRELVGVALRRTSAAVRRRRFHLGGRFSRTRTWMVATVMVGTVALLIEWLWSRVL
ncbi:RNA polymerase sigma factor (sigma-70 family) [Nonomuraea thailandensis]|uniref:RNA polymerase sigma factor (Sigma-70 family) n=1 Tax=Nonomuraea thailandensis TaxID=1188745 RepID=A0A9X2KAP2_9ACTN|nr:sigma-70 family RNA polymerase sigma factor [Nonomuraea thailandensis]MCP2365814.1 RNA polymerase sigma factor (sigma-70 family) [Nonomuraea thailandensis]